MNSIKVLSPAKINLSLKIGKLQKNGLHKIDSEMHAIELFDKIKITKVPTKGGKQTIKLIVTGDQKRGVPTNSDNLVHKAAKLFFAKTKIRDSVIIEIEKNIPNKAGLGGASSDAAGTVIALEKLFTQTTNYKLQITDLGSDVSFFYSGAPHAKISGTGDKSEKLKPKKFHCLIAMLPRIRIATPWAYAEFDKHNSKRNITTNDFEKVIFSHFPDLENLRYELLKFGAISSGLCGSGSAIFAIFDNEKEIKTANKKLLDKCEFLWIGKSCGIETK